MEEQIPEPMKSTIFKGKKEKRSRNGDPETQASQVRGKLYLSVNFSIQY